MFNVCQPSDQFQRSVLPFFRNWFTNPVLWLITRILLKVTNLEITIRMRCLSTEQITRWIEDTAFVLFLLFPRSLIINRRPAFVRQISQQNPETGQNPYFSKIKSPELETSGEAFTTGYFAHKPSNKRIYFFYNNLFFIVYIYECISCLPAFEERILVLQFVEHLEVPKHQEYLSVAVRRTSRGA